jgi:hypothetical protein
MCLPEKVATRIRRVESMEMAWRRFDALYNDHTAFIKDLMQEIRSVSVIKDGKDKHLMDYHVLLLLSHIEEANRAGLVSMLLIPVNVEEMVRLLPNWERRVWRERQGRIHAIDRALSFANFVDDRLEYPTNMVATGERLVLPKPVLTAAYDIYFQQVWARANNLTSSIKLSEFLMGTTKYQTLVDSGEGTNVWDYLQDACPDMLVSL